MPSRLNFKGMDQFRNRIDHLIEVVNQATETAVGQGAHLIAANAQSSFGPAHGKGTPKTIFDHPQSITGTLRRSIRMIGTPVSTGFGKWTARVAPTTVYGRRVELGFHSVDSLGRNYGPPNTGQPAYPSLKPGLDKSRALLPRVFETAWGIALQK